MTSPEILQLLRLVRGYNPAFEISEATPAVWAHVLADVDSGDATAAVHAHFAVAGPWISPHDVRRRVAKKRGLLPPDATSALAQARRFHEWLGRRVGPEPDIHPAALVAAREVGWHAFSGYDGVLRKAFTDAYTQLADGAAEDALTGNLAELCAAPARPKALQGGTGVEAAAAEERARMPIDHAAAEQLKAQIRKSGIGKLPAPPKPDYPAPTKTEIQRWSAAFQEWAAGKGYSIDVEKEAS